MERPGIMLYFTEWVPMTKLDDATLSALIRAAVMYGYTGEVPSFEGIGAVLWAMIQEKVDRDAAAYDEKCIKAKYSVYCREEKAKKNNPLRFEEWVSLAEVEKNNGA